MEPIVYVVMADDSDCCSSYEYVDSVWWSEAKAIARAAEIQNSSYAYTLDFKVRD